MQCIQPHSARGLAWLATLALRAPAMSQTAAPDDDGATSVTAFDGRYVRQK